MEIETSKKSSITNICHMHSRKIKFLMVKRLTSATFLSVSALTTDKEEA